MRQGFSLVELSIVLVILGLLTGGILAGQSLIRASELRAASTEYSRYATSVAAFRDKYFAIPGDFAKATDFWSTAAACPGTNATPSTTAATCNGNNSGGVDLVAPSTNEGFRFWHHLANAGMIEGSYSGVTNDASATNAAEARLGWNVPASKLSSAGWSAQFMGTVPVAGGSIGLFEGNYGNVFYFGTVAPGNLTGHNTALKPEEAWNIDTKLDDGRPGLGKVTTWENVGCTDTPGSETVAIGSTANYLLSATTKICSLFMKIGV